MAIVDPRYIYEDLLTMPDDGKRYELHEGDLLVSPSPSRRHQRIVSNLDVLFRRLEESGLGQSYIAPFDVVFDRHNVFEPDALFVCTERLGIVTEKNVGGPPDLVVEVLSDSTRDVDMGRKLRAYSRFGVPEYWAVDPDANTIEIFRRESGALVNKGKLRAAGETSFLGVPIKVREILA